MIKAIRHFGIVVKDLDESLQFYQVILGLKKVIEADEDNDFIKKILGIDNAGLKTVKLTAPDGCIVELLKFSNYSDEYETKINNYGPTHLAFSVEDIDSSWRNLKESGITFVSSPQLSPNGYAKVAFCQAPEGTYIELVEVIDDKRK